MYDYKYKIKYKPWLGGVHVYMPDIPHSMRKVYVNITQGLEGFRGAMRKVYVNITQGHAVGGISPTSHGL